MLYNLPDLAATRACMFILSFYGHGIENINFNISRTRELSESFLFNDVEFMIFGNDSKIYFMR